MLTLRLARASGEPTSAHESRLERISQAVCLDESGDEILESLERLFNALPVDDTRPAGAAKCH